MDKTKFAIKTFPKKAHYVRQREGNDIDEESRRIDKLVLSAREGQWSAVFEILGDPNKPNKSYLLNAIPQSRRWGVLHQATYWKNPTILRKVLKYPVCDIEVKAKKCMSEVGDTGRMTPLEIAIQYEHDEVADIIREHRDNPGPLQDIQTFRLYTGRNADQSPNLLSITIASYKRAFHPRNIDPSRTIFQLLQDIYNDVDGNAERWKAVRDVVADSVYTVNVGKAEELLGCDSKYSFFHEVVNCYTNENNAIYAYLNMAFRRQHDTDYRPTSTDLAVGPYCLMYQMLLLFWPDLQPESRPTYRQMLLRDSDATQYRVGTKFIWLSVVSSAVNNDHVHAFPTVAGAPTGDMVILFTIDNSTVCNWQPRNIEKHAAFPESERAYPAGAKFQVMKRRDEGDGIKVELKLIN